MLVVCICAKLHENIFASFKVIERTRFIVIITKGHNSANGVTFFFSAHRQVRLYFYTKFH